MSFNLWKMLGVNHIVQQLRPSLTQIAAIALSTGAVTDIIGKVSAGQSVPKPELMLAGTTVLATFFRSVAPSMSGLTPADAHSAQSQAEAILANAKANYAPLVEQLVVNKAISQIVGVKAAPVTEQVIASGIALLSASQETSLGTAAPGDVSTAPDWRSAIASAPPVAVTILPEPVVAEPIVAEPVTAAPVVAAPVVAPKAVFHVTITGDSALSADDLKSAHAALDLEAQHLQYMGYTN